MLFDDRICSITALCYITESKEMFLGSNIASWIGSNGCAELFTPPLLFIVDRVGGPQCSPGIHICPAFNAIARN